MSFRIHEDPLVLAQLKETKEKETKEEDKEETKEIDYNRIVVDFGSRLITPDIIQAIEDVTKLPAHHLLRRGLYYSHRDLELWLLAVAEKKPVYIYTGRGPSSTSLHLGHYVQFEFTAWLQRAFKCKVLIQITNDEKIFHKQLTLDQTTAMADQNIYDIIACGFDRESTYIFKNTDAVGQMYPMVLDIQRRLPINQIKGAFGFGDSDSVGKYAFVTMQMAPSFSKTFGKLFNRNENAMCLIPCAIDQDPFFRLTRDVARPMGLPKPAIIHSKFLPSLTSIGGKMSASEAVSAIYMSDFSRQVEKKIRAAVSGGGATLELHRLHGGDPERDTSIQYLRYLEPDDDNLARLETQFRAGIATSDDVKKEFTRVAMNIINNHKCARLQITDKDFQYFQQFLY